MRMVLIILAVFLSSVGHAKVEKTYYRLLGTRKSQAYPKGSKFEGLIAKEVDDVKQTVKYDVVNFLPNKMHVREYSVIFSKKGNDWVATLTNPPTPPFKVETSWPVKTIKGSNKNKDFIHQFDVNDDGKVYRESSQLEFPKVGRRSSFEQAGTLIDQATYTKIFKSIKK